MSADDSAPLYPTGGSLAYRLDADAGVTPCVVVPASPLAPPTSRSPRPAARSTETATYDRTLHAAPGRSFPRTLARAFDLHHAGKSVRVILAPGIYRESLAAGPSPSEARLLIEARDPLRTILRGSDAWGGWQPAGGLWRAQWPHQWGMGNAPDAHGDPHLETADLMRRREIVFVAGQRQRQVLARSDLTPGTFLIDEIAGEILLHPTPGVSPAKVSVEVGIRSGLLRISGRNNVTLRGLRFEHDASFFFTPQHAALELHDCRNAVVEDCDFRENNVKGLQITGVETDGVTLRRVTANHNGCLGILAARVRNLRLEDCETCFNNWRGVWAGKYRGSPCGIKILRGDGVTLLRHRAVRNLATGIWIDEGGRDVRILHAIAHGNYRGIHLEAGDGPALVEGCTVSSNRQEPAGTEFRWAFGSGIALTHSAHVTLRGNFLADNDVAQIGVRDDRETRALTDPLTKEKSFHRTEHLTLEGNLIVATGPRQKLLQMPVETFDKGVFHRSLRADGNAYIGADFGLGSFHATSLRRDLTLREWQALTGQDATSTHEQP